MTAWSLALPTLKTFVPSLLLALPDPTSDTMPAKTTTATMTPAAADRITMRLRFGFRLIGSTGRWRGRRGGRGRRAMPR